MSSELYRKSGGRRLSVSFCLLIFNFTSFTFSGEHYVLTTVTVSFSLFSVFSICFLNLNDLLSLHSVFSFSLF